MMMEKKYKVVFVYPDGHIEEIDQLFNKGREALDYGNSMLTQVANTEGLRSNRAYFDGEDDLFGKDPIKPYFMIVQIAGKNYHLVFDSRNQ